MTAVDDHVPTPDFTTTVDWHSSPDGALQALTGLASGISTDLTLYLPWGLVIGTAITGEQFFRGSAERIRSTATDAPTDGAEFFAQILDDDADRQKKFQELEPGLIIHQGHDVRSHLHLKEATCFVGGQLIKHPFLRIKLTHVSAWAYGRFFERA